jgi:hypothetical protein
MSDYTYTKYWTKIAGRIKPNWEKPSRGIPYVEEDIKFDPTAERYRWRLTLYTTTHRQVTVLNGTFPDDIYKQAQYDRDTDRRVKQLFFNLTQAEKPTITDTYDATVYRKTRSKKTSCDRTSPKKPAAGAKKRTPAAKKAR